MSSRTRSHQVDREPPPMRSTALDRAPGVGPETAPGRLKDAVGVAYPSRS